MSEGLTTQKRKENLKNKLKECFVKFGIIEVPSNDFVLLTRAFSLWYRVIPLNTKCEELAKELQEKTSIIDLLREAYLRDVVSVKYCVTELAKEFKQESKFDIIDQIDSLPSLNLRNFILKYQQNPQSSSYLLQETLKNVG